MNRSTESQAYCIRQARMEDADLLAGLSHRTYWDAIANHPKNRPDDLARYLKQAFNLVQISAELADDRSVFLLADIEGKPAGYAKLVFDNIQPAITAIRAVELERLYSQQQYWGKGVGQKLLDACFGLACDDARDVIWLGSWEHNPRAQRFYEKNGFRVVGSYTFMFCSDPQTDLLMQKEL